MNKRVKNILITSLIVLVILIFGIVITLKPKVETSEDIAKCIGQKAIVYTQLGCHACESQKSLFGESYQYLNEVDCFYEEERQKCIDAEITATPTWVIDGVQYKGVQSIEKLRELTGC